MNELLVDFITSLDGYGAAEGWPGFWGLEGPEYLAWLGQQPERGYTILMGANTYRLMYGFASQSETAESDLRSDEEASVDELTQASKVVFSSTLQPPLSWANTRLISEDAVEAVRAMKREGANPMRTLGSLTLCRSLLKAGLVDRFRVVVFPVITGSTGYDQIYDGYPIERWTVTSLPANWQQLRDRWELFHAIRSWVSVLGLALLLGGALFVRDKPAVETDAMKEKPIG